MLLVELSTSSHKSACAAGAVLSAQAARARGTRSVQQLRGQSAVAPALAGARRRHPGGGGSGLLCPPVPAGGGESGADAAAVHRPHVRAQHSQRQ